MVQRGASTEVLPQACGPKRKVPQSSELEGQAAARVARRTGHRISLKGWVLSLKKKKVMCLEIKV